MKIKANASKHKAMSYQRMKTRETELRAGWIAGLKLRKHASRRLTFSCLYLEERPIM
jgi:hypothetical protein